MHDLSYDWLKTVEKALLKVQQLPALEEHFPFPWEDAGTAIRESLGLSDLTLSCTRAVWKNHHEFLQGMGESSSVVALELAPIEGKLFFILPQADLNELTGNVLVGGNEKETFTGVKLKNGFYHFLLLKVLVTLDHLKIFKDVSLHLLPGNTLPHEMGFCIDVACQLPSKTLQARVVCPQSFLSAFKAHQPLQQTTLLSVGHETEMDLTLRCEVGHTNLSQDEWESLQIGDFLTLDRCSFDPVEGMGSLTAHLGDTPLFIARFKPEGLKVLDYAFYQEETGENSGLLLTAEVGSLKISLRKLLELKSGSMLDLPLRPENGIDVTLGGKRVAKAELIKLGQIAGLRILDIER